MKFTELPFGTACSAPNLPYVFCRVRSNGESLTPLHSSQLVYILGENEGGLAHLNELVTDLQRDDFFIVTD